MSNPITVKQKIFNLAKEAVEWRCLFENSNPDVGMGPSAAMLVDSVLYSAQVPSTDVDYEALISIAKKCLR